MTQVRPERKRLRYQQVMDELELQIKRGRYALGERLPSFQELSKSLCVNHLTIRKGVRALAGRGLLDIRPRVGVFVVDRPVRPNRKTTRIALGCRAYMFSAEKHHPAISAYLGGAHRRFTSAEVSVQTMVYKGYNLAEEIGQTILSQGVDGFIACTGGVSAADVEFFARHRIPLVHCGFIPVEHEWPVSIVMEMGPILRQGMDHLRQLGHRRIAFMAWERSGDKGAIHRQFERMVFDYQLGDVRDLHLIVPEDENLQWARIESFFDVKPRPTAVIVHDEFLADVLLAGCKRRGIDVPGDLSIVALQDPVPFGHGVPLTAPDSVKVNSDMIYAACGVMERMIKGEALERRQMRITPELISKASSGPVPMVI